MSLLVPTSGASPVAPLPLPAHATGPAGSIVPSVSAGLVLTPANGTVGTSVAASGTGFGPNSTIGFEFAGETVASTCSADPNGSFPGTSGTPCRFAVPAVAGGNQSVVAMEASSTAAVAVGTDPYGVAYDPALGEVFIANLGSGNVSVISDATNSIVAWIGVGTNPASLDYDAALGEVFVANYGSDNVSVISDATNSVVATISVGTNPFGVAYDSGTAEVFVANAASNTVNVIADSNNSVIATLPVGSRPYGVTYDAGLGEVFVCNLVSGSVSVISDTNDSVVATIGVGSSPDGDAYDSGLGEVFVANMGSSNVSVISDATDTVVATVSVGSSPSAVVYDPRLGEIFDADSGSSSMSVISDATDAVVATVGVGSGDYSDGYDAGRDEVFVANLVSGNVTVLPAQGRVLATTTFLVGQSVGLTPTVGMIGSRVTVRGTGFTANSTISLTFAGLTVATTCFTDATGSFPGTTGSSCRFTVPATAPAGPADVTASDGNFTATSSYSTTPGLTVSPTRGGFGTLVTATGELFAASTGITFTFAGALISSTCSTDPTGSFPGTSGTPCTFSVPAVAVPRGPVTITASDGTSTASTSFSVVASLVVTPGWGPVGGTLAGTGSGFAADAPIAFSVGGVAVASACLTDATGAFPGTSGAACTFVVPATPGGNETVVASDASGPAAISVGTNPYGVAYDPGLGELFVANEGSNNVSVISDATNSVVAWIGVGSNPASLDYDAALGEVFVANFGTDNVSVISDATNAVVATISVGTNPFGVAYDPGTAEIFVANAASNTVSVIADSNNSVVATVGVGDRPYGLTYDAALGEVFVCNLLSGSVSVVADSNNSVMATVGVGSSPDGDAYDSGLGEVFIANMGSDNVSVISDGNNSVVAMVPVGSQPFGLAYDATLSDLFEVNGGASNLSVISDATNTVVATIAVGTGPRSGALDAASGAVYVTNSAPGNVSVVELGDQATTMISVNTSLLLIAPGSGVDAGQTATFRGAGYGSSVPVGTFTLGTYSLSCTSASTGNCTGGDLTTDLTGSLVASFAVPTAAAAGAYVLHVADSTGHSGNASISLYADPMVATPSASAGSVDLGQNVTFSTLATFGTGSYTYAWLGLPAGCSGSQASVDCTPAATGTTSIAVRATDSNGFGVTSASLSFVTHADPLTTTPVGSLSSGEVDGGQNVTFTTTATLGTSSYSTYLWSGLPTDCAGPSSTVSCSGANLTAGTYLVYVRVTDSDNFTSAASPTLSYTVLADPSVAEPVASAASADVGQTVTFSATPSLGSGIFSFAWSGLPISCTGTSSAQVSCKVAAPGLLPIHLTVTDSNNYSVTGSALGFEVYGDPSVALSANRVDRDVGQSVTLTANATSGSGGYTYVWSNLPKGCAGATASTTCVLTVQGRYSVSVEATDSNGMGASSGLVSLVVAPALSAAISPTPGSPSIGEIVEFSSNSSGGTGPLTFAWAFGDGTVGTGPVANHSYASAGTFAVSLWVNDSAGGSLRHVLNLTVAGGSNAAAPASTTLEIVAGLVVVGVVAAVAALMLRTRRRKSEPESESAPPEDPSVTPMTEPGSPAPGGPEPAEEQGPIG